MDAVKNTANFTIPPNFFSDLEKNPNIDLLCVDSKQSPEKDCLLNMFNTKGKTKTRTRNYPHSNWNTKLYWDVFLNIIDDLSLIHI